MTPTPEQPSVSRELLELVRASENMLIGISNYNALSPDTPERHRNIDGPVVAHFRNALRAAKAALTQTQQPVSARVTVERETLELVCNEIQMHADTLRPAEELGFTVHGLDGLHSLLSGALTRSQPEAPAPAEPSLYERLDHWESVATRRIGLRRELQQELFGEVLTIQSDGGEASYQRALAEIRRLKAQAPAQSPALPAEVREVLREYDAANTACAAARDLVDYHAAEERRRLATVALTDRLRVLAGAEGGGHGA